MRKKNEKKKVVEGKEQESRKMDRREAKRSKRRERGRMRKRKQRWREKKEKRRGREENSRSRKEAESGGGGRRGDTHASWAQAEKCPKNAPHGGLLGIT